MVGSVGRAALASATMGAALWALMPAADALGRVVGTLLAIGAGGAVFWAAAWLLGSEEARLFTGLALRRVRRQP